ncbi:hypothetical protein DFH09DRAFT_1111257 [Mycena vulgaris]|nr:hypothetical protein DFH09DRAFT_1111257 [Mycena vulgaris]
MVHTLLFPCFTPSSVTFSRGAEYCGDAREHMARSWSYAERCLLLVCAWHSHWILFVNPAPPPPPATSQPQSSYPHGPTTYTAPTTHKSSCSLVVCSMQSAEYVLHKHSVARNDAPHNSHRQHLSVIKPTSHEVPADDSTPPPPTKKRKSPDLHEEGIRTCLRTCYPAEVHFSSLVSIRRGELGTLCVIRAASAERGRSVGKIKIALSGAGLIMS